jgi:sulfur carrier protein
LAGLAVTVNGIAAECPRGSSVAELLEKLDLPVDRVAVERNRRIVSREERSRVAVEEGDVFEIVTFVGGG